MGTSRGYGPSKYGSSGYGGSGGSSFLNTSNVTPRSSHRQLSYEPRLSSYGLGGSVMDRVKQINPEPRIGSYTSLAASRRAQDKRDYSGGGGGTGANSWDKYSSRSAGSDYSNRSGYMSDYGGSNPSLYGSWDRTSSRTKGYGLPSRETSPITTRTPARQYDYSSSATPSPYSTYRTSSEAQSPSTSSRYERKISSGPGLRPDPYEESPRPRRKWESDVYGAISRIETNQDTKAEPIKPPPKDCSSESDDSAPEDEKDHAPMYLMSRGTSPMPEPGKRERRSKDVNSAISKVKRTRCQPKDIRGRGRSESRRKRLVDCATQTNLDEHPVSKRNRQGGGEDNRASREEMAKLAAIALLNEENENHRETFYKPRENFQNQATPVSTPTFNKRSGTKFEHDSTPVSWSNEQGEERDWRKTAYEDRSQLKLRNEALSNRDSRFVESLDVPDEKSWRNAVYGDQSPAPVSKLKHYQTEEDLRMAVEGQELRRIPKTSTPSSSYVPLQEESNSNAQDQETRSSTKRERRPYNDGESDIKRTSQSGSDKRRSQNESDASKYKRSSSRDSIMEDMPTRCRRQRTSSRELLDDDDDQPSQHSGLTALTPDTLSLRDSIDKVQSWKQKLPPTIQDHQMVVDNVERHPETGFPKCESGEYFSAQDETKAQTGRVSSKQYEDTRYGQHSPHSPMYDDHISDREELLSPGGHRRRTARHHLSKDLSQESSVFDEDRTHHPVNKEKMRKSELNRSAEKERQEQEDLERRRRIYAGEDPDVVEEFLRQKRLSSSTNGHYPDELSGRARSRYGSRHNSREDMLDEKRDRRDKRESDPQQSDGSQFGFNREGSPNQAWLRAKHQNRHSSLEDYLDRDETKSKRHSRQGSQEGVLNNDEPRTKRQSRKGSHEDILDRDDSDESKYKHAQYMRPHSMVISNESLATLSTAISISSIHSAVTDDGTIQNSTSMQSIASNEVQAQSEEQRLSIVSSGGSLPDIIPGEESPSEQISNYIRKQQSAKGTKSGMIGHMEDIDNLLNFSPNEEEFVKHGKGANEIIKPQNSYILDAPVPREPSPMKPQNSERLVDLDESPMVSPLASEPTSPPPRKATTAEETSQTGKATWDLLKAKKGLVVISDILELCAKPKKPRFIRVPGSEQEEKSFRGYETANEMLENLQVDTKKLEDCAIQIYRYHNGTQGDYSTYLDLNSTIDEQIEELEGFQDQRKNALILRTQLTVRVHAVIEKLLNSNGRELRRALFSLKQIFQDDKDLVHEFVNNDGLDCLIKVGTEADQNYQNYILRALGQVMLYVDGMNGVINHNATIQWLYSLLASKFRLVVKTALKLLLVFVEYTETNAIHLVKAINVVDKKRMVKPWTNVLTILDEKDGGDSELLVYAMTLVNKILNALPDQDSFYDATDALEELGMERIAQKHLNRKGADLDLLTQFQLYEAALKVEDGEEDEVAQLENLRQTPRIKSESDLLRKSRRFSTGLMPNRNSGSMSKQQSVPLLNQLDVAGPAEEYNKKKSKLKEISALPPEEHEQCDQMPDQQRRRATFQQNLQSSDKCVNGSEKGPYTARSRRDRRARQCELIKAQEGTAQLQQEGDRMSVASTSSTSTCSSNSSFPIAMETLPGDNKYSSLSSLSETESLDNQHLKVNQEHVDKLLQPRIQNEESGYHSTDDMSHSRTEHFFNESQDGEQQEISNNKRWLMYKMSHKDEDSGIMDSTEHSKDRLQEVQSRENVSQRQDDINNKLNQSVSSGKLDSENTNKVKSELERLSSRNVDELGPKKVAGPAGDKSGLISQAMENLNKKHETSKPEPVIHNKTDKAQAESDLQWERLAKRFHRSLKINDMDFTDLKDDDDSDLFALPKQEYGTSSEGGFGGPPPVPPGMPPPPTWFMPPPPPPGLAPPPPPPMGRVPLQQAMQVDLPSPPGVNLKKTKKTVKLHWKVLQPEILHPATKGETIWKNIVTVKVDPDQLEHLFESKQTEVKQKRQDVAGKKEITVLDPKRSNAINIGLTVLPPPRTIKTAILKMDNSIMNKEGIEKILSTMIPSEEEKTKILEAQLSNPDIPLGTAEQFLLTLSSINELSARLSVWLFKLDYESIESEIAEPLMDLKKGIEESYKNKTLKYILSAILTIGNFLNGAQVRGFSIEYLSKVPEVKDTVHKHSILHHLCTIILEQFTDSTDLYSEIGPITRCSRIDWDELQKKLDKLEVDCKASWDHLRAIIKYEDSSKSQLKSKMSEFLCDAAERIMILQIVHKRIVNRYNKLLLYMGLPVHQAKELKVNAFCKILSEFALEYRTTREKVLQQIEKKANQRERKKTRGKMIVDMGKFKGSKKCAPKGEDQNEDELQRVLVNGYTSADDHGLPGRQARRRIGPPEPSDLKRNSLSSSQICLTTDSEMYDTGDDEILEACVRTATTATTRPPRERKRARQNRKSLRRTLKNGLSADEVNAVGDHSEQV